MPQFTVLHCMKLGFFSTALVIVIAAGCSSGPSSAPTAGTPTKAPATSSTPAGFSQMSSADFAIAIPDSWEKIDFSAKDVSESMQKMASEDKNVAQMLPQLKQMAASGQFKMFAFDMKNTEGGFTDNMNVIVQDSPGVKLDELIKLNEDQLKGMAVAGSTNSSRLKGANGDLGLIKWAQQNQVKLEFHTVLGVTDKKVFTFTFTCQEKHSAAFAGVVDQMVKTIELK